MVKERINADGRDTYLQYAVGGEKPVNRPSDPPFPTAVRSLRKRGYTVNQVAADITEILLPEGVSRESEYGQRLYKRNRHEIRMMSQQTQHF